MPANMLVFGKVRCTVCDVQGKDYLVALPFGLGVFDVQYDQDGRVHLHVTRIREAHGFTCSNGHRFIAMWPMDCWCGWLNGEPE